MSARSTKAPPYSILSEKLVLGGMLRDPGIIDDIHAIIGGADVFFRGEHGALYTAMVEAAGTTPPPADTAALIASLDEAGHVPDGAAAAALQGLAADGPAAEASRDHARIVVDKWNRRRLIEVATSIIHDVYYRDDAFDVIYVEARARLAEIGDRSNGQEGR